MVRERSQFIEKRGRNLSELLCRKNPWRGAHCARESCWPCSGDQERTGNCLIENVTYTISCMGCSEAGTTTKYTGETSRNMYLRGLEHHQSLTNQDEDSVLWQHCKEAHSGNIQIFHMNLLKKHKSAFERQVSEGVAIELCSADLVLNRKTEWNRAPLPKMAVEVRDSVKLGDDEKNDVKTNKDKSRIARDNQGQSKK